jgi:hypothetical protein
MLEVLAANNRELLALTETCAETNLKPVFKCSTVK